MARPPAAALTPGAWLGRYRVVSLLGRGGMGEIYRAYDERLGRDVAIKVVRSGQRASPGLQKRFETEARAVGSLNHPNVVAVFDAGEENGCPYLVTELLEGETLADRLRKGALAPAAAVDAALGIARALEAAHAVGVVHRDLKPANVFLTKEGGTKVLDFGLAKWVEPGALVRETTLPGALLGTPGYMSPEQARGEATDARSDLFSLGALLYEMLCGSAPFRRNSPVDELHAVLHDDPPPLEASRRGIARNVEAVVRRCLAKKPEDRFQSAGDVMAALTSGRFEPAVSVGPVRARLALLWAGIGLVATAGLSFLLRNPQHPPAAEQLDSIAVIPFVNLSSDKENEYFSDGITEELINALANIPGLRVASRTSVFALKGRGLDARQIGEKLGVNTLLEGSVRRDGNALRVTAQLIRVDTDVHLWSQNYDRELNGIFAVEDEIARSIAQTLRRRLAGGESAALVKPATSSQDAHDLYLRGQYFKEGRTADSLRKATPYFEQAIEKDPEYALAYVGLANLAVLGVQYDEGVPASAVLPKAKQAVMRALELDPGLAEAQVALGIIAEFEYDWPAAERALRRAIELKPAYPEAHHWLALTLAHTGRVREARSEAERAVRLDPTSPIRNKLVAVVAMFDRDFHAAEVAFRRAVEIDPTFASAHSLLGQLFAVQGRYAEAETEVEKGAGSFGQGNLGLVYALAGRRQDALRMVEQLERRAEHEYISPAPRGLIWVALGERERGYALLQKACAERAWLLWPLKIHPVYDFMRSDPQFTSLLKCLNLE